MTCTASDASLPTENPKSPSSKRKVHFDQQPCSEEHEEAHSNLVNAVSDIKKSHRISLQSTATEKVEHSEDLLGNKRLLAMKNEYKCGHLVSGTDLETERLNAAQEKVIWSKSKLPVPSPKYGKEFHKTDDTNYTTKLLKQEFWKSVSTDSDLLAQNTEKPVFLYGEKLNNLKEVAETVTSLNESHITLAPLKESHLHFIKEFYRNSESANVWGSSTTVRNEKAESENQNVHKDFKSEGDRFQVNSFCKMVKDKLLMLDHKEQLEKEKEHLTVLNQTPPRLGNQKLSEITVTSEDDGKTEALQKSLKNSKHLQKRVQDLQNENLALKNKVKPLAVIIQSLKEKISNCDMQIKHLAKEKKSMLKQLVKSQEDNKECIKEVKNLLRKCKELKKQKIILEEENSQLHHGNQQTIQALRDFQIRNKKLEEKMTTTNCEKGKLSAVLECLQKEYSMVQETNKKLEIKISQLIEEKSSLEQELEGNQNEIQQMKEKETAMKSEQETHLQLMQTLAHKKLNLETSLQECSNAKQMLLKDFKKVQSDKDYTEKKLMTELRNAKADIDLLKSNLTIANRECKRLSTVITNVTEENQLLKEELQEHRQDAFKYESDIRKLSEERLILENHLWTIENERDVLQFEFHHLHKDYVYLRGQATALVWAQSTPNSSLGTMQDDCSEYSSGICKEIPDSQYTALEYLSQGDDKITETQQKN
ncbi:coiled-coil domain-containing protein 110 [Oxyura jamaicensis]|uniref:coiled-coil domain-containing protein 110 n=1 Tax=Oxyura jamaicensis TaxID=8884 RepID=UPI0015A502B6|nr:coiled-coil domain-containing protein 110 [Oxyura jamaicensis]